MATDNKGLNQPADGSTNWGAPLNENSDFLDKALGDAASFSVNAASGIVALVLAEYQCMALIFNGTMTADVNYQLPSGVAGQWVIINNVTGAFDLTFSTAAGGAELIIAQDGARTVYTDGTATGVLYCDTQSVDVGADTQVAYYNASGIVTGSDGLTYNGTKLVIDAEDSGTNTVISGLEVKRGSTGTPANNIGVSMDFSVETAVADFNTGASFKVVASDVTAAAEDFDFTLQLMAAGTLANMMTLTSVGVLTVNSNAVITAGQASATQSLGQAGIIATADDDGLSSAFAADTYTPTPVGGNFKRIINDDAFTLAAPALAGDYSLLIQITNDATPGVITLSGFTKTSGFFTVVAADDFFVYITKCNGFTFANVVALQ